MISKVKCRPRRSVQWKVEMWGLSGPHFWVSNFNMLYFGHFAYNRFINCRSPPLLLPNTIPLHEYSSTVTCTYDLSVKLISSVVLPVLHSPLPNNEGSHFLRTWCKPPENSDVFTKVLHSACPVYNPLLRICQKMEYPCLTVCQLSHSYYSDFKSLSIFLPHSTKDGFYQYQQPKMNNTSPPSHPRNFILQTVNIS